MEQRQHMRRKVRIPVFSWDDLDGKNTGRGKELATKDISTTGMAFVSEQIYPINKSLYLDIYLPGKEVPISCQAKVTRVESLLHEDGYTIGVSFLDLAPEDKNAISTAIGKMNLYSLLDSVIQGGASDLHLTVGRTPMVRKHGKILPMAEDIISRGQVEAMIYPLLSRQQLADFEKNKELDFAFSPTLTSRFRVNLHFQKGFIEAVCRSIPTTIKSFEELMLPVDAMEYFCTRPSGLIILAGATGTGKTTTMSSMVNYLNQSQEKVIITVEDPIEYTFVSKKSIVKQRELGSDTMAYSEALKRALRQDPDVICIGELLDKDCLMAAFRAAETGHLVISTVHAPDSIQAVERMINFFPPEHAASICQQLSSTLIGILSHLLVPKKQGGVILATELLFNNHALKNLIRESKYSLMRNVVQTGRAQGMYTLEGRLKEFFDAGFIEQSVFEHYTRHDTLDRLH